MNGTPANRSRRTGLVASMRPKATGVLDAEKKSWKPTCAGLPHSVLSTVSLCEQACARDFRFFLLCSQKVSGYPTESASLDSLRNIRV